MSDPDLYRRNPARDIEAFAAQVAARWVGDQGTVTDTSSGHGPDFRIDYADGRSGLGEVGWHENPVGQAMWQAPFRQERYQTVPLLPGHGLWTAHLQVGANIQRLHRELPGLIRRLIIEGVDGLEIIGACLPGPIADVARRLGIDYLSLVDPAGTPSVIYFFGPKGGIVPQDANVITDWIEAVLLDPARADMTAKLLAHDVNERHVFVMSGSSTPFGVDERLRRLEVALPARPPKVPEGITHVWVVAAACRGAPYTTSGSFPPIVIKFRSRRRL